MIRIANGLATAATVAGLTSLAGFLIGANLGWEPLALACAWTAVAVVPALYAASFVYLAVSYNK
jgi:hypothetical protein